MDTQKLTLKLKLGDDFRRIQISKNTTFAELLKIIQNLYRLADATPLSCKWTDDEGDACTVSCDEELYEAVHSAQANLLRIDVFLPQAPKPQEVPKPQEAPKPEPARTCPVWTGRCHGWRGRFAARREEWSDLGNKGIQLMDQHNYSDARSLFEQQLLISAHWQKYNPLYNIACCDSLLGNTDSALAFLSRAIEAGYRDLNHLEADEDLVNLRHLPGYKILVNDLKEHQAAPPSAPQLFNLACCQALLGNVQGAVGLLQKAAEAGFFRLNMLLKCPDLASIRELDEFKALLNLVQENKEKHFADKKDGKPKKCGRFNCHRVPQAETSSPAPEQAAPAEPVQQPVEVPVVAPVEEPASQPAAPVEEARVPPVVDPNEAPYLEALNVLYEMGFHDRAANLIALQATNGDVVQAITLLLA
jgi:tetratricopeptide (TPR) repeat protein